MRVAVIGAGIAGCSTACHLLRMEPETDVVLLEKERIGAGSTSRSAAAFRQQWSVPAHVAFSLYSAREYEAMGERGRDVLFRRNGYLFLYTDEDDFEAAVARAARQREIGVEDVTTLEPDEIGRRTPVDGDVETADLAGATWCPSDGFLDPLAVAQNFLDEARERGVEYRPGVGVREIAGDGGGGLRVVTEGGDAVEADAVVNAAGPWSRSVARAAGFELPLKPAKRYLYFTRPLRSRDVGDWPLVVNDLGPYMRPSEGNALLMGWDERPRPMEEYPGGDALRERQDLIEEGYSTGSLEDWGWTVLAELAERVPFLAEEAALDQVTTGYYVVSPDEKAVISEDPRLSGLFHATGFSGHGIMHGAAAGRTMAELVLGRETSLAPPEEVARHFGLAPLLEGRLREPVEEMVI